MNTIRNLPFPLKLGAITLVMLLPVLLLGVFFVRTQMEIISFAQNENAGAEYYHELEESLIPLGERENPELTARWTRWLEARDQPPSKDDHEAPP